MPRLPTPACSRALEPQLMSPRAATIEAGAHRSSALQGEAQLENSLPLCNDRKPTFSNAVSAWPKMNEGINKEINKAVSPQISHFDKYWLGIWQKVHASRSVVSDSL